METPHYIGRRGDIHKHFVGRRGGIPNVDRKGEGVSFKTSFNVELFLIVVIILLKSRFSIRYFQKY
jgi:hypothetical protein